MHNECVESRCFNQYFHNLDEIYCVMYKIYVRNISREDITMCNLTGWIITGFALHRITAKWIMGKQHSRQCQLTKNNIC